MSFNLVNELLDFLKSTNNNSSHNSTEQFVDFRDTQGNVILKVSKSNANRVLDELNRALDRERNRSAIGDDLTQGERRAITENRTRGLKSKKSKGSKSTKKRTSAKKKVTKKRTSAKKKVTKKRKRAN